MKQHLMVLVLLGALLGACSTQPQTEPAPPEVAAPVDLPAPPVQEPPHSAQRPDRLEPPAIMPAPGAVTHSTLLFADVANLTQPGLMLLDVQSDQAEFWTLAAGTDDPETGIGTGSYHSADGRFILLKTWDQRRFLTDRVTGETWTWSTEGWQEVQILDDQILIRRERETESNLYALRYDDRSISPATSAAPPNAKDWSANGVSATYTQEAGLPALLIADRDGAPQYRIRNSLFSCSWFGAGGSVWLADGSALVVGTYEGTRLLELSGAVVPLPYDRLEGIAPSPTDPSLIAYLGRTAEGRSLVIHDLTSGIDRFASLIPRDQAVDLSLPRWHPTGRWFQLAWHQRGGGYDCEGIYIPLQPKVDKAPFPPIQYQVQRTGGCLTLRESHDRLAKPLTCLPDGTILTPEPDPGTQFWRMDLGGAPWLRVRVDGKVGWVIANEGFITWAP